MTPEERERLARTYVRHARTGRDSREWAVDRLWDLVALEPEEAWPVTRAIVAATTDERALSNVGAGPLETLVRNHGAQFIDRIEMAARSDAKFRFALSCVWASDSPVAPRLDALLKR